MIGILNEQKGVVMVYHYRYYPNPSPKTHPYTHYSYYQPYGYHTYDDRRAMWSDYGPNPLVLNIAQATRQNTNFRTTIWTGNHLQLTLMHLNPGEDIGLEIHQDHDQFIRVEEGEGLVQLGDRNDQLTFQQSVYPGDIIMIPAGKWHNIINTGQIPLKIYSLYGPPEHPYGTIHPTKPVNML